MDGNFPILTRILLRQFNPIYDKHNTPRALLPERPPKEFGSQYGTRNKEPLYKNCNKL
jgi:hypothetical protein